MIRFPFHHGAMERKNYYNLVDPCNPWRGVEEGVLRFKGRCRVSLALEIMERPLELATNKMISRSNCQNKFQTHQYKD